jgi:hypothetical protein
MGQSRPDTIIIVIARVSSRFIVHKAASLPRCWLGHHQTNPAIEGLLEPGPVTASKAKERTDTRQARKGGNKLLGLHGSDCSGARTWSNFVCEGGSSNDLNAIPTLKLLACPGRRSYVAGAAVAAAAAGGVGGGGGNGAGGYVSDTLLDALQVHHLITAAITTNAAASAAVAAN